MKLYETHAILNGGTVLITEFGKTKGITEDGGENAKITITPKQGAKKEIDFYSWGKSNNLPDELIKNAYNNNVVASNLDFNARIGYGDSPTLVRKSIDEKGELKYTHLLRADAPDIFEFLENSNINLLIQESIHDQTLLHNSFVEFIMNKAGTKVVRMLHKEASYSRLSVMDEKTGQIEWHGYSAKWAKGGSPDDVVTTPLLDFDAPLYDFKRRLGRVAGADGKKTKENHPRYVMHVAQPSPGKFYYQKAYWWSIFESHWYDFACAIPEFKMNLLKNQMVLKYHVQINKNFFESIFKMEGITEKKKQDARRIEFYKGIEDFLSGSENAGKNLLSYFEYSQTVSTAVERQDIKITPIESFIKGGEYIEDSEEASNAICYAMGVHPSLQGASPGKNKTINGTEARELFIIKQSMMKPLRDLVLEPLRIVKAINGWPEDIDIVIPNITLTTLDKNTGSEKQIGNQKL